MTSISGRGRRMGCRRRLRAQRQVRSTAEPRLMIGARARRHHVLVDQVAVEIGIDGGDLAQRRLVELLQDGEADPLVELALLQRGGERVDDGYRGERVAIGLKLRLAHQVTETAIQHLQLVVALILDHAGDVAGDDRLVHRCGVDQRQLGRIDLGEIGLGLAATGNAGIDATAQLPLELDHQRRPAADDGAAGVEIERLVLAHVRPAGPVHQHVADAVEHLAEREQQPVNGEIPAIAEDLRDLPGGATAGSFGGQCVHA
jgi:hypothetical protein